MLPWSVMASPRMPSSLARLASCPMRSAPSRNEYCVWTWRCTNSAAMVALYTIPPSGRGSLLAGPLDHVRGEMPCERINRDLRGDPDAGGEKRAVEHEQTRDVMVLAGALDNARPRVFSEAHSSHRVYRQERHFVRSHHALRNLVDLRLFGQPKRRDGRKDHFAGPRGQENSRRPAEPDDELSAIARRNLVADVRRPPFTQGYPPRGFIVHHRSEHGHLRVAAHEGHMGRAKSRERARGPDRVREGRGNPGPAFARLVEIEELGA